MVHFILIFKSAADKKNYDYSLDQTSLEFCESLRFFLAVFVEKFQKQNLLSELREKE